MFCVHVWLLYVWFLCVLFVPSVLWYCWLGLLTCKNRLPYNLYCVGGDVKHCSIQSNARSSILFKAEYFSTLQRAASSAAVLSSLAEHWHRSQLLLPQSSSSFLSCTPVGERGHQSPEWTILSHSYHLIQWEIVRPQILLDCLHSHSTRASGWSPPVLQRGRCY